MNIPSDRKYTATHEWAMPQADGTVRVGITDFAQQQLGDLVYVNLPQPGDTVSAGEPFGDVESVKAVSDLMSPVSGTISAVNEALADAPELLNETPWDTWIMEVSQPVEEEALLDETAYDALCREA